MSADNWEQILKELEQIKSNWQEKKLFLESEKVKTDSPGKKFELKKEIQKCDEEIQRIATEINSLKENNEIKSTRQNTESNPNFQDNFIINKDVSMKDVFICHASEDKPTVVEPLVTALKSANISCWYDKAEIHWGDSITQKVNEGLNISKVVIVVLSPAFLNKNFSQHELNSVLNIEIYSKEVKVLPLVVTSTKEEKENILISLPLLNSKAYETWDGNTDKIIKALQFRLSNPKANPQSQLFQIEGKNTDTIIESIHQVQNSILEEFTLDTAKKVINIFVASSIPKIQKYIEFLEQIINDSSNITNAAIRGEAGCGKTIVAKATYIYLDDLCNRNNKNIKLYYIDWLWTVEKKFAMNELLSRESDVLNNQIVEITNYLAKFKNDKVILIIDGLDRYNQFAQDFVKAIINLKDRFSKFKCIFFERIYLPVDKYNESIEDDRIVRDRTLSFYKYHIQYILENIEEEKSLVRLLTEVFHEVSDENKVSQVIKFCKNNYPDFNNIRLIHILSLKDNMMRARNSADVLKNIFQDYIDKNPLKIQDEPVETNDILEEAKRYAYEYLFLTAKQVEENKQEAVPRKPKTVYIKRLSTQTVEMSCYLSISYIFRVLFIEKNFSDYIIVEFNKVYPKLVNKYAKDLLKHHPNQNSIFRTIENNYDKCDIRLKSFLAYLCGRFSYEPTRKQAKKFLKRKINNLSSEQNSNQINSENEIPILERTIRISLIFLGDSAIDYIKELMNNPKKDSINRSFHLTYYGDLNYFSNPDVDLLDEDVISKFTKTYKALRKNIENYICQTNQNRKEVCELSIYTLYSLVLNRYQNGTLNKTVCKQEIIDFAQTSILSQQAKIDNTIRDYVKNCLQYLKSDEKPLLQIIYWILQLKKHPRTGWNKAHKEDITRIVPEAESVMAHIASAAILATTFLPETHDKHQNYDKNKVIKLILMHDIGEYEFGDIVKPLEIDEDRDKEKNAVDRLNMVGSIMNSTQLESFSNPQKTIYQYWNSFTENSSSDINVAIAHDIDTLECLLQLHNYQKNKANTISDFEDFKSSLEKCIKTTIVDHLAKLLLGNKYK